MLGNCLGGDGNGRRLWQTVVAVTAIIGKEYEQVVHAGKVRGVKNKATVLPAGYQAGARKMRQVKRQGRRREVELLRDAPGIHALRPHLQQQSEYGKTGFLSQGGKTGHGICRFHISSIIET